MEAALLGERVVWLGSGSGLPQPARVRWIGRLPEIGPDFAVGLELERALPYGGIDGSWAGRRLFACRPRHGLIVPSSTVAALPRPRLLEDRPAASAAARGTPSRERLQPVQQNVEEASGQGASGRLRRAEKPSDLELGVRERRRQTEEALLARYLEEEHPLSLYCSRGKGDHVVLMNGSTSETPSVSSSGSKRSSGGFFAFLRWFKREKEEEEEEEYEYEPGSPVLRRIDSTVTGSVDTLFSTATASSFAFVHPSFYRPYGPGERRQLQGRPGGSTEEVRSFPERKEGEQRISLKEKYNLYASGTIRRSVDHIHELAGGPSVSRGSTLGRKKRRAPQPPTPTEEGEPRQSRPSTLEHPKESKQQHRRTVSESAKYRKVHVKGKRRAPEPPAAPQEEKNRSLGRKKRQAPQPPVTALVHVPATEPDEEDLSDASTAVVAATDTLRLERGVLRQNKMDLSEPKPTPSSPVSPRPWYKRSVVKARDSAPPAKKKEKRGLEDWVPEGGFPRRTFLGTDQRFNVFGRLEDKRKSQISILTNISELDREAAAIVERGKARERELLESHDAGYYDDPPKKTTKELISLFNAITDVTKVTVNTSFFAKETLLETGPFYEAYTVRTETRPVVEEPEGAAAGGDKRIARVTIEELDEYDAEDGPTRAQALFEANRLQRHKSPAISTIAEVSESSRRTSPASTVESLPGEESGPATGWVCPACTLDNRRWRITCEACDAWRPEATPVVRTETTSTAPTVTSAVRTETVITGERVPDPVLPEEVRKARLAYFNKPKEEVGRSEEGEEVSGPAPLTAEQERIKLREMLKDLKHSLPKRPKYTSTAAAAVASSADKENINITNEKETGAIKKVPQVKKPGEREKRYTVEGDTAEAFLIESETRVEEVKYKKPSSSTTTEKVSSSAQTSALVRQIVPQVRERSRAEAKEVVVPITVEEYRAEEGGRRVEAAGGPHKEAKRIAASKFQLMRPRDFANIKAIKTGAPGAAPAHLYANVQQSPAPAPFAVAPPPRHPQPFNLPNLKVSFGEKYDSKEVNTLAVNRLLRKLEAAIVGGEHDLAASLAKDLALLKVNCSVTRQKTDPSSQEITVEMYVEDKVSHQGPIPLRVRAGSTVAQLKRKLERELDVPVGTQRWILGKRLATDDLLTLQELGVASGSPVFLYLVAPESGQIKEGGSTEGATGGILEPSAPLAEEAAESGGGGAEESATPLAAEEEEEEGTPPPAAPTTEPTAPPESPTKVPHNTGTLALGWRCGVCTLVNSPTRPGCAACTTERPREYAVPQLYSANKAESARLAREKAEEDEADKRREADKMKNYQKLMDLEKDELVVSGEGFECPVCLSDCPPGRGVLLRECLHTFCRECLANTVEYSEEAEVKCPYRDNSYTCNSTMLEREIKALVTPQVYEQHLAKSIALAENNIGNAFHCKTPDCKGWCIYEDNVNLFHCPVCTHINCLTCQAIHEGLDCRQFQEQVNQDSPTSLEAKRTKEMLKEMVDRGEAMNCPTCQVVLMKKWGCDWLRCSMCKTEICWVTRGHRWGPNGKGDTTGGCQCGVNGVKCHPKCNYCH